MMASIYGGVGGFQLRDKLQRSVNLTADMLEVSFTSANRLIERMVEIGILVESTRNARNRVFGYRDYIYLFADEGTQ